MMNKKASTKIVYFITPGAGFRMLECGNKSHYSEYKVSSTLSIYNILIAFVLWDYDAAFL